MRLKSIAILPQNFATFTNGAPAEWGFVMRRWRVRKSAKDRRKGEDDNHFFQVDQIKREPCEAEILLFLLRSCILRLVSDVRLVVAIGSLVYVKTPIIIYRKPLQYSKPSSLFSP